MEEFKSREIIETQPGPDGILSLEAVKDVIRRRNQRDNPFRDAGTPEIPMDSADGL